MTQTMESVMVEDRQADGILAGIFASGDEAQAAAARRLAETIRGKAERGKKCVLGLATGSTAVGIYQHLIRMHREEGLSFANVTTFNLDEYYPLEPTDVQSYRRFMFERLFDHVDIDPANVHLPSGTAAVDEVTAHCAEYEAAIAAAGGLDLQLLGIGRNGHIGFNEPGAEASSRTRMVHLHPVTREDAAGDFGGINNVPATAISMGVATILSARQIVMVALGAKKAAIVRQMVDGPVTPDVPATYLHRHPNVAVFLDEPAASQLR